MHPSYTPNDSTVQDEKYDLSELLGDTPTFGNTLSKFHDDPRWLPRPDKARTRYKPNGGTTYAKAKASGEQVRFILGDSIGVIALHNCAVDGVTEPWAMEIVERCDSYTEATDGSIYIFVLFDRPQNFAPKGKRVLHKMTKGRVSIISADGDCPVSGARIGRGELRRVPNDVWKFVLEAAPKTTSRVANLDKDSNGKVKSTPDNASILVSDHRAMQGVFAFDELLERIRVLRRPDGTFFTGAHWEGGVLSDAHVDDVRRWLSASPLNDGIGTNFTAEIVVLAIGQAGRKNLTHPIRDYLESLPEWDGTRKLKTLFVDYLGCPNTPYHRETAILWMTAAVARVFEPGHKFDYVPIIEGEQGARKSTFVETLGIEWSGAPTIEWSNPQKLIEATEGYWIIEIGELASLNKSEANDVKEALTKREDRARMPYARLPISRRRQCVFMGTTNDDQYLRDPTGNRRFWPIKSSKTMADPIDIERLRRDLPQIWAEALNEYEWLRMQQPDGDLPLTLTKDASREAATLQASRKAESDVDVLAGRIRGWLDEPVHDGEFDPSTPSRVRQATCTLQIWKEMLDGRGTPNPMETKRINHALKQLGWIASDGSSTHPELTEYGRQRVFRRPW